MSPGSQKILQLHRSWAPTYEAALSNAMTERPDGDMNLRSKISAPRQMLSRWRSLYDPRISRAHMLISEDPTGTGPRSRSSSTSALTRSTSTTWAATSRVAKVLGRDVLPKHSS